MNERDCPGKFVMKDIRVVFIFNTRRVFKAAEVSVFVQLIDHSLTKYLIKEI